MIYLAGKKYESMNIYQKLAVVQQAVDVIQKDSSGYGYKYVSEAVLLPKISAEMDEVGLTLYPEITPESIKVEPYSYKKTRWNRDAKQNVEEIVNEFRVCGDSFYTWVNNDAPSEKVRVPWVIIGNQSDSSQAFGSALTYSERYFMLKFFHCATVDDDPDAIRSRQKEDKATREIESILDEVGAIIDAVVSEHPDERKNIRDIVTKYVDKRNEKGELVPTGDYKQITKRARAVGLLKELQKQYLTRDKEKGKE